MALARCYVLNLAEQTTRRCGVAESLERQAAAALLSFLQQVTPGSTCKSFLQTAAVLKVLCSLGVQLACTANMSDLNSSDEDNEMSIELRASPGRCSAGESSSGYLKTVVRQQQEATKTCRLLALEVGGLKAELIRESKKRAQAVNRATKAEAAYRSAEQRLLELQYSNSKLQQERTAAKEAADSSSRRVHSLKQSLAATEAEAQERTTLGQQQVLPVACILLAATCLLLDLLSAELRMLWLHPVLFNGLCSHSEGPFCCHLALLLPPAVLPTIMCAIACCRCSS
jgi:hypothetical protein